LGLVHERTPKHGRVQVGLVWINSHVEIHVADNGPGIDEQFLPHIFERFRQVDRPPRLRWAV